MVWLQNLLIKPANFFRPGNRALIARMSRKIVIDLVVLTFKAVFFQTGYD